MRGLHVQFEAEGLDIGAVDVALLKLARDSVVLRRGDLTAWPARLSVAVKPYSVWLTLLARYPGQSPCACLALGSLMFGKMLGPMSADAGTVKGIEYTLVAPETVAVAIDLVEEPYAVVVRPSAGFDALLCWPCTRGESASSA